MLWCAIGPIALHPATLITGGEAPPVYSSVLHLLLPGPREGHTHTGETDKREVQEEEGGKEGGT